MLGKLTRQNKANGSLDLARGDSGLFVVAGKLGSFLGNLLKDVIDEAVHDPHGLAGNADIGVNLLKDLEDVDLVRLHALLRPLLLLVRRGRVLGELLLRLGLWAFLRLLLLQKPLPKPLLSIALLPFPYLKRHFQTPLLLLTSSPMAFVAAGAPISSTMPTSPQSLQPTADLMTSS